MIKHQSLQLCLLFSIIPSFLQTPRIPIKVGTFPFLFFPFKALWFAMLLLKVTDFFLPYSLSSSLPPPQAFSLEFVSYNFCPVLEFYKKKKKSPTSASSTTLFQAPLTFPGSPPIIFTLSTSQTLCFHLSSSILFFSSLLICSALFFASKHRL